MSTRYYYLHNPAGNGARGTIPTDYRTNPSYAWIGLPSAERCATAVAEFPMHRVAVDTRYVPDHVKARDEAGVAAGSWP